MKSKHKDQLKDRKIKKSETEIHKNFSDSKLRRKTSLNSLLQKSSELITNYNSVFKKPLVHFGDADTYFRQILRNYDRCDYIRSGGDSQLLKTDSRLEIQKTVKPLVNKTKKAKSSIGLKNNISSETQIKQIFIRQPDNKEEFQDSEALQDSEAFQDSEALQDSDAFFGSETYRKEDEVFIEEADLLESPTEKSNENKMAEDFTESITQDVTQDITDATTTGAEATGDATETETDLPEDEMDEVERMIKEASTELEQVAEENKQLMAALEEPSMKSEADAGPGKGEPDVGTGSTFKFDPTIDNAVLKELEAAEKQAKETAAIINELKSQVAKLLLKEKMTEAESKELEQKNKELKAQMILFEEKTKRIQFLLGQANLFEKMIMPKSPLQEKHKEDVLPKVIVCGITENNMPKIIVCDDKKKTVPSEKKDLAPCGVPANVCGISSTPAASQSVVPQFAKKLNQSYTMQERLAAENANLECTRYKLQSDLLNKDQTVESLQRKVTTLQNEMRMICRENCLLNDRLNNIQQPKEDCCCGDQKKKSRKKMKCGKGKGPCPADVETRLAEYSETTHNLEKQLVAMETEVKTMQNELTAVQKEREHLEHHRKLLCKPPPPCAPMHPCAPLPPCAYPQPPCGPSRTNATGSGDQQYRELREQYVRLEDDFKSKVTEVAGLRADNEKLKKTAKDAEESKKTIEDKLKELERQMKELRGSNNKFLGSKEQLIEQEQQLAVAKKRFREAQDELEELRALIQDQQSQMDDYRNKYLLAQQQVEEQKRQIDLMEMENSRVSEQVNLEIQRVKNQFQEKLQELTPLPEILKNTQLKLREAQQMHLLAERNNEALTKELQVYKDKVQAMLNQIDQVRSDQQLGEDKKMSLSARLEECEKKCEELLSENDNLKSELSRMEELAEESEKNYQEKLHEVTQLSAQLDNVREESARQVAKTKDRCETVRRSMQNQISDLERQLAQSRAQARAAQKDRDDIRQKMQAQINNLNENFEDAQMRIRSLQGHVNFLKHSYTNVFPAGATDSKKAIADEIDPCACGKEY